MSKSSFLSGIALAAALSLFAGCGGDDDSSDISGICKKACDLTAPLKCSKAATCVADCEKEGAESLKMFPNCKSQILAVANCQAARPVSDWECDADGSPEPKENVCTAEQTAAVSCIFGGH